MKLRNGSDGRTELLISEQADERTVEETGRLLQAEFGAVSLKRVAGPDQSYWDFKVGGGMVTLHREHYLGVWIFAIDAAGEHAVQELARRLGAKGD